VFYGLSTVEDDDVSTEVCDADDTLICPQCDHNCDFTRLSASCGLARLAYVFHNPMSVIYTVVVCVWSAVYFQSWSQYRAELAYKWRVYQCEEQDEVMLPEFQQRQKKKLRVNPVTHMEEPVVPTLEKVLRYLGCWLTVLFIVSGGAVLGQGCRKL